MKGAPLAHGARRRRGLEQALRRLGVFLVRHLILRIGAETPRDRIDMIIDRLRELQIVVHRVADRLRLVLRDAAVIAGQQHRPFGERHEQ